MSKVVNSYKTMKDFIVKEKLAGLRKKWLDYKKKGDEIMCTVIEKQAELLKKARGK